MSQQVASTSNAMLVAMKCNNCGMTHQVEIQQPRVYNLPSTTMLVVEHAPPFMCPKCLYLVTPCMSACPAAEFVLVSVKPMKETPAPEPSRILVPDASQVSGIVKAAKKEPLN